MRAGGARGSPLVSPSNGLSDHVLFLDGRSVSPGVKHATYEMNVKKTRTELPWRLGAYPHLHATASEGRRWRSPADALSMGHRRRHQGLFGSIYKTNFAVLFSPHEAHG
jgi:hypothetical protein